MRVYSIALALGMVFNGVPASASIIFSEGFESYSAVDYGDTQNDTGLRLGHSGTVSAWNQSGAGALHAVDRSGSGNWALMFYNGTDSSNTNTITLKNAISANTLATVYTVNFVGAGAIYQSAEQGTRSGDSLGIRIIDGLGSVIANYTFDSPAFTYAAYNPFSAGSFTYTGNGVGDVKVEVVGQGNSNSFGGALDDFSISGPTSTVAEPTAAFLLFAAGGAVSSLRKRRKR